MKTKKYFALCIIGLVICFIGLCSQDNEEYKKAIARCGNEKNVITHYDLQGDKYYSCKVDK